MVQAPILYRETRLTPAPASPSHILNIDTSGSSSQRQSLLRAGSKRTFDEISGLDEDSYARKYLATEGSVFFRSKARSPRSFLWRVLDDRKVLEIQAVDLVKERGFENTDSWLTFRVDFKEGILEHGVQFADPEESDALECFVLTAGKELVTVTLKRDLLTRANVPAEFDASTCVKRYSSSFLTVRHPYRFHAVSSLQLLIALADGGLVRLDRKANESGAQWRETFFSEGGWRGTLTLKGFNPFAGRPTVRYGNLELDPTAIANVAQSPDGKYVWTVSLDHWLRAWSTASGRVILKQDLLNQNDEKDGRQPYLMSAEQGKLLQIVVAPFQPNSSAVSRMDEDGRYAVVVRSPKDHRFKIYDINYTRTTEGEGIHTQDLQSSMRLIPPIDELMNTNIWHLEQFHLQPGVEWMDTQLWIRARSGALCRTFLLTFDVLDGNGAACDVTDIWARAWSVVDTGPSTAEELKQSADYPGESAFCAESPVTPSEKWLQFLFYPGRFTKASLETSLHIYRKGRGLSGGSSGRGLKTSDQPLEDRLNSAITSKVLLRRLPSEQPDYQRYHQDIQTQWQGFYAVLSHLHARRHESVGFAFDAEDDLPWSVCADYIAPVRACSGLEMRSTNTWLLFDGQDEQIDEQLFEKIYPTRMDPRNDDESQGESQYLGRLLAAARDLRRTLSFGANQKLQSAARRSALQSQGDDAEGGRASALFEECNMEEEVTDDAFDALSAGVESLRGLGSLKDEFFDSLLGWLDEKTTLAGRDKGRVLGRYGVGFNVEVAREMLTQAEGMLFDVLAVVAFMAGGLEEGTLDEEFDADYVFGAVVTRLRRNQLLLWLAGHQREKTTKIAGASRPTEPDVELTETVTLLDDIFIGDWQSVQPKHEYALPELLTLWSSHWISGPRLDEVSWDGTTTHILSRLVKAKEVDLGVEFLHFTDRATAWSTYVQGRLHILTGDYPQASLDFQQAAEGMAAGQLNDTANLLSPDEKNDFGGGMAVYFQHIAALFEKLKVYSHVADLAKLALEHTEALPDLARSMAKLDKQKSQHDSPALERIDAAQEENRLLRLKDTRDEILNRLFNALVLTGRFGEAYEALQQIQSSPMQRSGLKKVIDACVKQDAVPILLGLPFEDDLAQEADKALFSTLR